jgi:hypothetical protein
LLWYELLFKLPFSKISRYSCSHMFQKPSFMGQFAFIQRKKWPTE